MALTGWRPKDWKTIDTGLWMPDGNHVSQVAASALYELGADAMLAALKQEGTYLTGDTVIPAQGKYPEIHVPGGTKGWLVIIYDEEK